MQTADRERIALFWAYDSDLPSFRYRIIPLAEEMESRGWTSVIQSLSKGRYLRRILERQDRLRRTDVLVLHGIKVSPVELWPLRRLCRRIVFDVDDAIYYRRPRQLGDEPDKSWLRRFKFERTCAMVDLVLAGNPTIAAKAERSARRVAIVPTPVDLSRHEAVSSPRSHRTLVWIGLPENLVYLELIRPVIAALTSEFPDLRLRVVSSRYPDWAGVAVEGVSWSASSEAADLASAGIGVMPLPDDDWARGKCGFKLLQYMASALPCVGSAVGANLEVVEHGVCGFLASDLEEWEKFLRILLVDPETSTRMGAAGRERVRERYDVRVVAPRAADLVEAEVWAEHFR